MVNILDDEECEDNSSSAILVHCLILSGYASSASQVAPPDIGASKARPQ